MYLIRAITIALCLVASGTIVSVSAQDIGDPSCDRLLLVSAYTSNNVKIYNACDGSFIRNLDSGSTLQGPQAIAIDPQGDLVVVSEENDRLVRYHRETLTYDRVIAGDRPETPGIELAPVDAPTGLVITADGRMIVGSFSGDTVTEINPVDGSVMSHLATMSRSGIRGPDAGMLLDGNELLVPGFNSSTVVRIDLTQPNSDTVVINAGSGTLSAPRQILRLPNGNLLVSSWRNGKILEYNGATRAFVRTVTTAVGQPTGMAFESGDVLLVASDGTNEVSRVQISTGTVLEKLITFNNGLLADPVFILLLEKIRTTESTDLSQNRAFWTIGVGSIEGNSIDVEDVFFTHGGAFGQAFDPDSVSTVPWGSLAIEFDSCDSGHIAWTPRYKEFDAGSYDIFRLAEDPFGDACTAAGFDTVDNVLWMSGLWFGGAPRDGEGFSVNLINGNLAVVTWYTYLPAIDSL
jgi:WD40 repeat protein